MSKKRENAATAALVTALVGVMDLKGPGFERKEQTKTKSMCRSEGCFGYAQYDKGTKCRRHKGPRLPKHKTSPLGPFSSF